MSITMPEAGFVLPVHAVRRAFYMIALGVSLGAAIPLLTKGSEALPGVAILVASVALLTAVAYPFCVRVVWVRLDEAGIRGYQPSGTKASVQWSESVTLQESSFGFVRGILIKQRSGRYAVFLPGAIASQPEFLAALQDFAPVGHPLRSSFEAGV